MRRHQLTESHAQHLLAGGGLQEAALVVARQVHAMRFKVLQQQPPHPQRRCWQRFCPYCWCCRWTVRAACGGGGGGGAGIGGAPRLCIA